MNFDWISWADLLFHAFKGIILVLMIIMIIRLRRANKSMEKILTHTQVEIAMLKERIRIRSNSADKEKPIRGSPRNGPHIYVDQLGDINKMVESQERSR